MYGGVYRVGKVGGRRGEGWLREGGGVGVGVPMPDTTVQPLELRGDQ